LKLRFEDYPNWLSQELDRLVKPTTAKGRKLIDESNRSLDEARGFFDDLSRKGDKDMASKKDPVSYKAARLVGHSAREAHENLDKAQPPVELTWESLKSFKDQLSTLTKNLRDIRAKTVGQLSGFYLLDMRSFGGVNDRILKHSEKLTHFLEGDGSVLQQARTLTSALSEAESVKKEIVDRSAELAELAGNTERLRIVASKLSLDLDKVENDPMVKELIATEKNLRNESRRFKAESLAHLKRPLRRLRDLSERGDVPLTPEAREALKLYIDSPYRSFLSGRAGAHLNSILENLRISTNSGKLGFKPRKAARVRTQLDQLLSTDELAVRQLEGRKLLSKRKKLSENADCKRLYDSRKDIIEQIAKVKAEISDSEEREHALEQKSKLLNSRLQELLTLLETKTRQYTGREVQVEKPVAISQPQTPA
jgi:hypothetical protein